MSTRLRVDRAGSIALAAVAVLFLVQLVYYARIELIDDAYISFRYAKNLVDGHGLVFNPGERVEGYTNFLWVLLMAIPSALGVPLEAAARVLGGIAGFATLVVTAVFFPPTDDRSSWTRLPAPALLTGSAMLGMWSEHGLETSLFALLVTVAVRADANALGRGTASIGSALAYALAALTRPEGVGLFVAALAYTTIRGGPAWRSGRALGRVGVFALLVGAHLIFRLAYYGDWVPNTFHAKVGADASQVVRGAEYLLSFAKFPGALVFLLWLPVVAAARKDVPLGLLAFVASAYLAIVVAEGGDAFGGWRFVAPIAPVLYLGVQEGFWLAWRRCGTRASAAGLLALAVALGSLHAGQTVRGVEWETRGARRFMRKVIPVGHELARAFPPDTYIALNAVGAIPYLSGLRTLDLLGLTDRHIAKREVDGLGRGLAGHEKGDGAYVLERRPDVILLGNVLVLDRSPGPGFRIEALGVSEHELIAHPDFKRLYTFDELPLRDGRVLVYARLRDAEAPGR